MTTLLSDLLGADGLNLLQRGGAILWLIMAVSLLMWLLIAERYLYLWWVYPKRLAAFSSAHRVGRGESLVNDLNRCLLFIRALDQVLPLLGLLGTLAGMIEVFEVMAEFGSGHTRGLAGGISTALITTLAGLLTALSGLYFCSDLENRVRGASDLLKMQTRG